MGAVPTPAQAKGMLEQYNKEEFHILHGEIVGGVLGEIAKKHDPQNVDYWTVVGILHDIDYEMYPEEHSIKSRELLRDLGVAESIITSTSSHCFGLHEGCDIEPTHIMEKYLFAIDELTGLIGAAARMRPSKSCQDMELKSVMKKFKTPAFAAGCSREVISLGAERLGMQVDELCQITLDAMKALGL